MITNDAIPALLDDDDSAQLLRSLLIFPDAPNDEIRDDTYTDAPISDDELDNLRATARELINHDDHRELLTATALSLSLCPLHLIDYAICFDDDRDDCRSIRTIHPSHDS